jgi:hypothetical protein
MHRRRHRPTGGKPFLDDAGGGPSAAGCGESRSADRHDDWLIVWEHDPADIDIVRVLYIGTDPFA